MKLGKQILMMLPILMIAACNQNDGLIGPQGPPGPQGDDGLDGADGLIGTVLEYEVDFTAPEYSALIEFPQELEIYESDKVLVYLLWDVTQENVDIWRMLPQTIFTNDGLLQYNFDFTVNDINLFMEANYSLDLLGAGDTDNQIFRIVVVPAAFLDNGARVDFSDYDTVKEMLGLPDLDVDREGFQGRE